MFCNIVMFVRNSTLVKFAVSYVLLEIYISYILDVQWVQIYYLAKMVVLCFMVYPVWIFFGVHKMFKHR